MLKASRLYINTSPFRWLISSSSSSPMATKRFLLNQPSLSTSAKKKKNKTPIIGTHNGTFHCDEALACFLLRRTAKFSDAEIVRTRDLKVMESLDAVVDVGGVYDPSRDRYDHHQSGFCEVLGHGFTTKLSSAGLVYKHYGMEVVSKEVDLDQEHPNVHRLFLAVYKNFIEAVDAVDNGINQYDIDQPPKYVVNTSLSSRVGRLNLDWVEDDHSAQKENEAFRRAMELTGKEFLDTLNFYVKSWLPARSIVMECLEARNSIDPSGEIVLLTKYCPWKLHIFELEEEMKIEPSIKYVIYQEDRNNTWRVQAVKVSPDKFESRKPLPSLWRGLERKNLSEVTGIPGCVFTHMSGFIGGNQTYEGALKMAKTALRS